MSKKKRKQIARQNKALLINTMADQEKIFNEMKNIVENVFTYENMYRNFVEIIDYYKATSESSIFLKSVHWIQNEMNKYLTESKSANDANKEAPKLFDTFTTLDASEDFTAKNAETDLAISSSYIAANEKLLIDVDDLIMKLIEKRNSEQLIRLKFARIKKILTTT